MPSDQNISPSLTVHDATRQRLPDIERRREVYWTRGCFASPLDLERMPGIVRGAGAGSGYNAGVASIGTAYLPHLKRLGVVV